MTLDIEFSDSSFRKDLDEKTKVYAEAGIAEYWVLNLRELKLIVFRNPLNEEYQSKQTYTTDSIQPLAFPDTSISINLIAKNLGYI